MKHALTATVALMLALPARAEFMDGNFLYQSCSSPNVVERMDCLGYISGVFDALQGVRWCAPTNVTRGQVKDIVMQFLTNNPALRSQESADVLIRAAIGDLWACPQRQPQSNPRSSNWS